MKSLTHTLLKCVLAVMVSACSENYKSGNSGISEEDLFSELESMTSASAGSGRALFNEILNDKDTVIYFARSGTNGSGAVGPARSVISLDDFSQFGSGEEVGALDLTSAKVALLVGFDASGHRRFVLSVHYQVEEGSAVSAVYEDEGFEFKNNKLQIQFSGAKGAFYLETFDTIADSNLKPWIHLKMIEVTDSGEILIGQFSALEGFGK